MLVRRTLLATDTKQNASLSALPDAFHLAAGSLSLATFCYWSNTNIQHAEPSPLLLVYLTGRGCRRKPQYWGHGG